MAAGYPSTYMNHFARIQRFAGGQVHYATVTLTCRDAGKGAAGGPDLTIADIEQSEADMHGRHNGSRKKGKHYRLIASSR